MSQPDFEETHRSGEPQPRPAPPQQIGPYAVEGELAAGGQGVVLRARHTQLGTRVALKLLTDEHPTAVARFEREAKLLARLHHRNLPAVTDLGFAGQGPFLAMELIEGRDLKAAVAQSGIPEWTWTVEVLETVAEVLHYCHQHGVVHRDVKPHNILIERETGRPVLVDFGLAKPEPDALTLSLEERSELSTTGEIKGTPAYMAPEQATAGMQVGPPADVYGLGATLYHLLTGEPPYQGNSLINVLHKVFSSPVPDPVARNPDVPLGLADLCQRALAKDPADRPQTAQAFAAELRALSVSGESSPGTLRRTLRLRRRVIAAGVVALVFAVGAGAGFVSGRPTAAETRALEAAAAQDARLDAWGLAERMLGGRGVLTTAELDRLTQQSVDGAPWAKWVPFVRARSALREGAAPDDVLRRIPVGPDRDLLELEAKGLGLRDAELLRLAASAAGSQLPWAADPLVRWDRLATDLDDRGRASAAAAALTHAADLAAERGDTEGALVRLVRAGGLDIDVVHARSRHLAPRLVAAARETLEAPQLTAADAPAVSRARERLVLYRMLEPDRPLPAPTLAALERLAERKVHALRSAVLPRDSWVFRLQQKEQHLASLRRGQVVESLRSLIQRQGKHVAIHLQRYWLLHLPKASRKLWSHLGYSERVLGRFHRAQRALEVAASRTAGLPPKDQAYEEQLLAHVHQLQGEHARVVELLEPHKRLPIVWSSWSRFRLAQSLGALGRYDEGRKVLEGISDLAFWRKAGPFWWLLADLHAGLGHAQRAAECWAQAARAR